MANTSKINDARYDRSLHSLYRMGFESARVDDTASRSDISNNWCDDWQLRYMDGSREQDRKKTSAPRRGILMFSKIRKYFKRLWCAVWNKKCHDDCDCV